MREQDQVKALCEWAGWKWDEMSVHSPTGGKWSRYGRRFYEGGALEDDLLKILPDTNSLDVLHDFEKRLTKEQRLPYHMNLVNLMDDEESPEDELWPAWHATAAQRREALLRTLNLWREDSNEEGK